MKNLDLIQQKKTEIMNKINKAMKDGNEEALSAAFTEFTDLLQEAVMNEAKGLIQSNDNAILAGRGVRALTSEETNYYQKVIDGMKSSNPKQALTGMDDVLPKTILDAVFEDLQEDHPLLNYIDFQPTGALVETIISTTSGVAKWGALTKTIADELTAGFSTAKLTLMKLSAFLPVAKSMLDLGPAWMDRYVRAMLGEALAVGLEEGIVDGDGKGDGTDEGDGEPIGMTRALTGAIDGVYPRKIAVVVNDLSATTIGSILNTISQGPNSKRRNVPRLLMVVNPADYYTKVYPATTPRTADGTFTLNALPYPMDVVVSASVPANHAIFGFAKRYFMGLGTSKGGKIEYSDEYKFLEDNRIYLVKLYGNGKPLDANAFVYADISGMKAYVLNVYVSNDPLNVSGAIAEVFDARLSSLKVGVLMLTPAFNKSVMGYTLATSNATNTITAVAMDGEATIEILNGETPVINGAAATWAEGANTLTINVTSGTDTETYTVTVTYTAG